MTLYGTPEQREENCRRLRACLVGAGWPKPALNIADSCGWTGHTCTLRQTLYELAGARHICRAACGGYVLTPDGRKQATAEAGGVA